VDQEVLEPLEKEKFPESLRCLIAETLATFLTLAELALSRIART
jgi:hypothetical protein